MFKTVEKNSPNKTYKGRRSNKRRNLGGFSRIETREIKKPHECPQPEKIYHKVRCF